MQDWQNCVDKLNTKTFRKQIDLSKEDCLEFVVHRKKYGASTVHVIRGNTCSGFYEISSSRSVNLRRGEIVVSLGMLTFTGFGDEILCLHAKFGPIWIPTDNFR